MAIAPYRASTDLFRPLLEEMFGPVTDGNRVASMMRGPAADVVEKENEIQVTVEMPGFRPDDLQVDIENNVLTIAGEKSESRSNGEKEGTYHLTERRYGRFSRSFVLPRDVEQDSIRATFEHGVLTVIVPKSERARRRRIEVSSDNDVQRVEAGSN